MITICGEFVLIIFCGSIYPYKCVFVVNGSGWILSVGVMKLDEGLFYTWVYVIDSGIRNGFDLEKNIGII